MPAKMPAKCLQNAFKMPAKCLQNACKMPAKSLQNACHAYYPNPRSPGCVDKGLFTCEYDFALG
jgi:hypothetical protein